MTSRLPRVIDVLRASWGRGDRVADDGAEYTLLEPIGRSYAALSNSNQQSVVIPLMQLPSGASGRRAAGCELLAYPSLRFAFAEARWSSPAAVLSCRDPRLVDAFAVLAADLVTRADEVGTEWNDLVDAVAEWQALLTPSRAPRPDGQLGLWGELWFIAQSTMPDRVIQSWRGFAGDNTDFFLDGVAVEVKTSRTRGHHFVSLEQVAEPVGEREAWLASLWVKPDPAGPTVGDLVDAILAKALSPDESLRQILRSGYDPADRTAYTDRFCVLAPIDWYFVTSVPRVREADPGVSRIRYLVTLDHGCAAQGAVVDSLVERFGMKREIAAR